MAISLKTDLWEAKARISLKTDLWEAISTGIYAGILKRWDGAWIQDRIDVYDGANFITKPLKMWDGASWVLIENT
jgi:hypothetical protein